MTLEVKCAGCDSYFPLPLVVQEGNGYYCKKCLKKHRDAQRHVIERAAKCIFCGKELQEGNRRTVGGYPYCEECSERIGGKKQGPAYKCSVCGELLSIHDVRMVRDGKEFCEKCHRDAFPEEGKERRYCCSRCGKGLSRFEVKMKAGENYCADCLFEAQNESDRIFKKVVERMASGETDEKPYIEAILSRGDGKKAPPPAPGKTAPKMDDKAYGDTAQLFKGLGDPCRVKIIESLADHDMSVFAFVEITGYQYSAISYHLKMMKELGLIDSSRNGNFQVYSLTNKGAAVHEFIRKSAELK